MARFGGLKGSKLHRAIWIEAWFCIAIFGFNQTTAGGLLTTPAFARAFPAIDVIDAPEAEKHQRSTIQGTIIALYTLLGIFGAITCTFLGDTLGRRWTIFTAAGVQLIGSLLMSTSYSLAQFAVARCFLGLGTGGIVATVSVWQSELSRAETRGAHVSAFGIFCGSGLAGGLWLDFAFSFVPGSASWRVPLCVTGLLSIFAMAGILLLPESPRWLMRKDRADEAREMLQLLNPVDQDVVEKEIRDIELALACPANLPGARCFPWLTGVNAITYYSTSIFETDLGFATREAQILAACSQFTMILGSMICSFTVDRFGRRSLMLFSAASMSVCFIIETALLAHPGNSAALKAAVFILYLWYVVNTMGFLGLPFLYASEIAPTQVRAAVCGISTAVSWTFNFMVAEVTPVAFSDIGWRYFIVYTVLNAAFVPLLYFFFPETAGRSLEEIDAIFVDSKAVFDPPRVARQLPRQHLADIGFEGRIQASKGKTEQVEQVGKEGQI